MKVNDQLGREVELHQQSRRIISIVPSQTEYLYDLGLGDRIVGQTIFCIHPQDKFRAATKVGGTKRLHIDKIKELKPDIIVANKEENDEVQIKELAKEFRVWISDIKDLDGAVDMMTKLGAVFDSRERALEITDNVIRRFNSVKSIATPKRTLYLIWNKPWMAAGRDTFVHAMLSHIGLENAIADQNSRYPELSDSQIENLDPELILLSSEPFPFKDQHKEVIRRLCPEAKIELVDGEMFSWYGSRLLKAPEYFRKVTELLNQP